MSTEQQAALLREIADVMEERPEDWWREFEITRPQSSDWHQTDRPTFIRYAFSGEWKIRRRPRIITIAGLEVPEPMRKAPKEGYVHVANPLAHLLVRTFLWESKDWQLKVLRLGLVHATEDAAQQHARALILASGGEVE